ncbi:DNA polymerase beta domain-containing protein [Isorropodon fossajaponicum endosymbiont JTNG4]|uniref:nucleotidyltransferase domain-containing protein n=1 Tax=Isorropodon fossajaponicum symbiont TaxID=883811 RepID=UPI001915A9F5|nr:nucleotidyltransferase domain-containing protein [Isorropodon fossajaponicum symbiont]BBB23691.1 DNA polymerase beta domain-containing protein [Isorropodon fossajaponicum endosymbiont JTNG4]
MGSLIYKKISLNKLLKKHFNHQATVRLFDSRIDDNLKGGDIDLLLEFSEKTTHLTRKVLRFNTLLQKQLGVQKIDIITLEPNQIPNAIQQQALKTGIELTKL